MIGTINNVKTAVLLFALIGLFMLAGYVLGQGSGLLIGLLIGLVMNFGAWFFSDRLAIAAMQAQEVDARSGGELYAMVDELRQRAGLPMPRVYISPHQAPNAFATGRSPKRAAVCFTAGAIDLLSEPELRGVAAHELAHIKNRDTLISTVAATIAGVFSFLAWNVMLFGGLGGDSRNANPLAAIGVLILGAVGAALLKSMISRSREFVADADGAAIAGTPMGLVSALQKLEAYSRRIPLNQPNPAANNLFIIEPMVSAASGGAGGMLGRLMASHPPTEARVRALLREA